MSNKIFSGHISKPLSAYEGLTVGIAFPKDFLIKQDYTFRGIGWLLLPLFIFIAMYFIWENWGKDEEVTLQTDVIRLEISAPQFQVI